MRLIVPASPSKPTAGLRSAEFTIPMALSLCSGSRVQLATMVFPLPESGPSENEYP